jgi:hypothetical protein
MEIKEQAAVLKHPHQIVEGMILQQRVNLVMLLLQLISKVNSKHNPAIIQD